MDGYDEEMVLVCHDEKMRALMGPGVVGREAVGEWFGDWFRTFGSGLSLRDRGNARLGDTVLLIATHHARGRTSGVPIEQQAGWIYTLQSERSSAATSIRAELLDAAGLT